MIMGFIYRFLFPSNLSGNGCSLFLLMLRVVFGLLLMSHGVQKWVILSSTSAMFPDPIGLGGQVSLLLAIFAELFCSLFFIVGMFYRLALIPMIITLGVAFLIIHGGSIVQGGELAFVYLVMFILLYVTGPGKYSVDHLFGDYLAKKYG